MKNLPVNKSSRALRIGLASLLAAVSMSGAFSPVSLPTPYSVSIEGRLPAWSDGAYDMEIEVRASGAEVSQIIRVAKVEVSGRRFEIPLRTELKGYPLDRVSIQVKARPFETNGPFREVIVARVSASSEPGELAFDAGSAERPSR